MSHENPYAGQPEEAPYDRGLRDGLAEPETSHPVPLEFADDDVLQSAYLQGEADGRADAQVSVMGSGSQPDDSIPDALTTATAGVTDPRTSVFWLHVDQSARTLQEIPRSEVKDGQPAFSFTINADPLCVYEDGRVRVTVKVSGRSLSRSPPAPPARST